MVVDLAPARGRRAAGPDAVPVSGDDRPALDAGVEPRGPSEVDRLTVGVHDDPRQLAVTQDPKRLRHRNGRPVLQRDGRNDGRHPDLGSTGRSGGRSRGRRVDRATARAVRLESLWEPAIASDPADRIPQRTQTDPRLLAQSTARRAAARRHPSRSPGMPAPSRRAFPAHRLAPAPATGPGPGASPTASRASRNTCPVIRSRRPRMCVPSAWSDRCRNLSRRWAWWSLSCAAGSCVGDPAGQRPRERRLRPARTPAPTRSA